MECRVEIGIIRSWPAELLVALTHMTCTVTALTMLELLRPALLHVSLDGVMVTKRKIDVIFIECGLSLQVSAICFLNHS